MGASADFLKWDGILAAVAFAMRATVHTTNRATATQLVFGRDAMLNVSFEADWQYIKARKQKLIRQNNQRENSKRIPHVYQVGDRVLVEQDPNRKHGENRYKGPYPITRVNDNGTVTLAQDTAHGGVVSQTWNIRQLQPYKAWSPLYLHCRITFSRYWCYSVKRSRANVRIFFVPILPSPVELRVSIPWSWGRMQYTRLPRLVTHPQTGLSSVLSDLHESNNRLQDSLIRW